MIETTISREDALSGRKMEPEPVPQADEAAAYDAMVRRHAWLLHRPFVKRVASLESPRCRVLDVGTGPGWIPIALAQQHPDWDLWALDPSPAMLARGRRHAAAANLGERIRFVPGSGTKLPFDDRSFDLVISHFTLHHVDRPVAFLNEAARVVRPGGTVLIKDLVRQPPWKAALRLAFEKCVLGNSADQVEMSRASIRAALTLDEVRAALAGSRLAGARLRRCWGPYFLIEATGERGA